MLRFNAAAERFNLYCAEELIDLTTCFNEGNSCHSLFISPTPFV